MAYFKKKPNPDTFAEQYGKTWLNILPQLVGGVAMNALNKYLGKKISEPEDIDKELAREKERAYIDYLRSGRGRGGLSSTQESKERTASENALSKEFLQSKKSAENMMNTSGAMGNEDVDPEAISKMMGGKRKQGGLELEEPYKSYEPTLEETAKIKLGRPKEERKLSLGEMVSPVSSTSTFDIPPQSSKLGLSDILSSGPKQEIQKGIRTMPQKPEIDTGIPELTLAGKTDLSNLKKPLNKILSKPMSQEFKTPAEISAYAQKGFATTPDLTGRSASTQSGIILQPQRLEQITTRGEEQRKNIASQGEEQRKNILQKGVQDRITESTKQMNRIDILLKNKLITADISAALSALNQERAALVKELLDATQPGEYGQKSPDPARIKRAQTNLDSFTKRANEVMDQLEYKHIPQKVKNAK